MADLLFEIPFSLTGVVILIIASVMWHFIWRKFVKQDTAIKWLVLYILSFIVGVFILCPLAVKYYVKTMFLSIFN